MRSKTLHVYQSDGTWVVKKEGKRPDAFGTKREAVALAVRQARKVSAAQIVIHGNDGRVLLSRRYGNMPKIRRHPKKSHIGDEKIARAVAKVVIDRLRSEPYPPRVHASAK